MITSYCVTHTIVKIIIRGVTQNVRGKMKYPPKNGIKRKAPQTSATIGLPKLNSSEVSMGRDKLIIKIRVGKLILTGEND